MSFTKELTHKMDERHAHGGKRHRKGGDDAGSGGGSLAGDHLMRPQTAPSPGKSVLDAIDLDSPPRPLNNMEKEKVRSAGKTMRPSLSHAAPSSTRPPRSQYPPHAPSPSPSFPSSFPLIGRSALRPRPYLIPI